MKRFTTAVLCIAIVCLALGSIATVSAQEAKPLLIADILKTANVPLTADQTTKLKAIKQGMAPEGFMTINEIFNEKQTAALKESFGAQQGFGEGMPESPRMLLFIVMFENEGCPFTADQAKKIKALPGDMMAMFEQAQTIYNEKQNKVMQSFMQNMMPQQ
jgi:hypothetical protein